MSLISIQLRSFADLEETLVLSADSQAQLDQKYSRRQQRPQQIRKRTSPLRIPKGEDEDDPVRRLLTIPSTVQQDMLSDMLDVALDHTVSHWCCIGIKVAPVTLDNIRDWHSAPVPVIYCIAAISVVSLGTLSSSAKDAAFALYARARCSVNDLPLQYDGINNTTSSSSAVDSSIIMAYFCLSYTSNLLGLDEHQRTWAALAAIALRREGLELARQGRLQDDTVKLCWYRWYYIDAWMALALDKERLLPDDDPPPPTTPSHIQPYRFVLLAQYIRRYLKLIRANGIYTYDQGLAAPSTACQKLTHELAVWHASVAAADIHLTICCHSTRLIVLSRFFRPPSPPPTLAVLLDCLQTILDLLDSFQMIRDSRCDSSTYHHLFTVIHQTATAVYHLAPLTSLRHMAAEQLRINLALMENTVAFTTDTFALRARAAQCRRDLATLGLDPLHAFSTSHIVFRLGSIPSHHPPHTRHHHCKH